jgi:hypothetical protein
MPELREMAELTPAAGFVSDVMQATVRSKSPWAVGTARLGAWLRRQLIRPQFSLEAAYVGTLLLILLCGTPISPLKQAPQDALAVMQAGPSLVNSLVGQQLGGLPPALSRWGQSAWLATGGQLAGILRSVGDDIEQRGRRSAPARVAAKKHGEAFLDALTGGRTIQALTHLREVWTDLRRVQEDWFRSRERSHPAPESPAEDAFGLLQEDRTSRPHA